MSSFVQCDKDDNRMMGREHKTAAKGSGYHSIYHSLSTLHSALKSRVLLKPYVLLSAGLLMFLCGLVLGFVKSFIKCCIEMYIVNKNAVNSKLLNLIKAMDKKNSQG